MRFGSREEAIATLTEQWQDVVNFAELLLWVANADSVGLVRLSASVNVPMCWEILSKSARMGNHPDFRKVELMASALCDELERGREHAYAC